MQQSVFFFCDKKKIFGSVIFLVAVFVVHFFAMSDASANNVFHNKYVFENNSFSDTDYVIPRSVRSSLPKIVHTARFAQQKCFREVRHF